MYIFPPMMVPNSQKHHCRVRPYTREVLVISTNLNLQKNHYCLDFTNRRGVEARIKNTWYNQGLVNECHRRTLKILLRLANKVFQEEQAPSTSGNQEQDDDFDFWTNSYASDDDEIPTKQVSQDIMEEISLTIDEAKLRKMADEMLR
ncbi:hypothetical protein Tco_0175344 [Tanacetum coccineum]